MRKVWVAKPLRGQAIRTSHARLITGAENAISTAWKDRFLCFWFYTPHTGEGLIHGYPIEWDEAHLLVRIDPNWDYDRQKFVPAELADQVNENLERQFKHGERVFNFFINCKLTYPLSLLSSDSVRLNLSSTSNEKSGLAYPVRGPILYPVAMSNRLWRSGLYEFVHVAASWTRL